MHYSWKKDVFTIPNILSLVRLLLIPVYIRIYLHATTGRDYLLAAIVMALSCLTDAADGIIARKFNMISRLGQILDPIADKLSQLTLTACLAFRYQALIPLLILFLVKETFQLVAAVISLRQGKILPGALMAGKVCTTVLFISLIYLVMFPNLPAAVVESVALLNAGFLTFSFVSYIFAYYGKDKKVEDLHPE